MRALRLTLVCCGITQGMRKAGFPLDESLETRSIELARGLRDKLSPADRVLVAPALRARQTAELLGLDAEVMDALRDQDYGRWSGMAPQEIESREPGALAAWRADPSFSPGGGDSLGAVAQRAAEFLAEMRGAEGHVVAVTHASVIRAAVACVLQAPVTASWNIDASPLCLTDLRSDGNRWALRSHGVQYGAPANG